ncbi:hypothetical protein L211DRAFT_364183 [Terfezia boudieri ATCC MYA-4762]|uniref:SET domain-containing protein n=1 Tax=Terfezia boudieri ATCC MYA-4762 TaxID=1051890 RepID=A0A3N4LZ61_9PEZI|nr:hypothetical protein L211DRAFT_364183 [Terfezia boudieri ATCC MYA-4762]
MSTSPSTASPPPTDLQSQLSFSTILSANKAFSSGALLEARELCTKALVEYTPYHPVAYANRACIYSRLGYHDLAAGDAYRAVMLMEYVRAVLEGLEEEEEEEGSDGDEAAAEAGEEIAQDNNNHGEASTPPGEGGTDAEDEGSEGGDAGEAATPEGSDEEGEPTSIFTHIAQASFSTVSQFLKLSNGQSLDDTSDVRRVDLAAFVSKFDMLASFYLINSLRLAAALLDAYEFCESTLKRYNPEASSSGDPKPHTTAPAPALAPPPSGPGEELQITPATFISLKTTLMAEMNLKLEKALETQAQIGDISPEKSRTILSCGVARRECYPWNTYEPDRFSASSLAALNVSMTECAERASGKGNAKCEARVLQLPDLNPNPSPTGTGSGAVNLSNHLGIFATEDIYEGEVFFEEITTISGHPYPGKRILCDYCSSLLPQDDPSKLYLCPSCPKDPPLSTSSFSSPSPSPGGPSEPPSYPAYCSPICLSLALSSHHPTLCGREDDLSWIHTDILTSPNPISIYSTLLIKLLSTSLSQRLHPLLLPTTRYLYGVPSPSRALMMRWDFVSCVVRPIWILTQCLNIDVYAHPEFDTWVITTLLAKIMGTCSGRFEPALGLAHINTNTSSPSTTATSSTSSTSSPSTALSDCDDRPEVVNVHPTWALVNHDCEPNVGWRPEGKGRFWGLQPRGVDAPRDGVVAVRKGEEVKSCYTDRRLEVRVRREWARDMLGGDCLCARCLREESEEKEAALAPGKTDGEGGCPLVPGVRKLSV